MPVEGFKVDVEKAVGHVFESEKVVCNRRDFLLYALGVGVKEDELKYLYELSMYRFRSILGCCINQLINRQGFCSSSYISSCPFTEG